MARKPPRIITADQTKAGPSASTTVWGQGGASDQTQTLSAIEQPHPDETVIGGIGSAGTSSPGVVFETEDEPNLEDSVALTGYGGSDVRPTGGRSGTTPFTSVAGDDRDQWIEARRRAKARNDA